MKARVVLRIKREGPTGRTHLMINILGISGTVVKDGNCDKLVKEALKAARESGDDIETRFVTMADKENESDDMIQCNTFSPVSMMNRMRR